LETIQAAKIDRSLGRGASYDVSSPNEWRALPIAEAYAPIILPAPWCDVTPKGFIPFGKAFTNARGLRVIFSVEHRSGEDHWLHVSVSRKDRIPSWEDLKQVKNLFIGPARTAIQILPKADEYVNYHKYTLHRSYLHFDHMLSLNHQ